MHVENEKKLKAAISAKRMQISVVSGGGYDDFISLTDIAKYKSEDPAATIQNWMRSRDVIELLGLWETLYHFHFKPLEFERFKTKAGSHASTLSSHCSERIMCMDYKLYFSKKRLWRGYCCL